MLRAQEGDTVCIHYTGKLLDGTQFESSYSKSPLVFKIGQSAIIPGLENAVVGMFQGEKKSVYVASNDGYGERNDSLVWKVKREMLPTDVEPEVGQVLESLQDDGRHVQVIITDFSDTTVTLDGNHPLAGHDVVFDLELVEILEEN